MTKEVKHIFLPCSILSKYFVMCSSESATFDVREQPTLRLILRITVEALLLLRVAVYISEC